VLRGAAVPRWVPAAVTSAKLDLAGVQSMARLTAISIAILEKRRCGRATAFQFMDLGRSNRKKVYGTTDECPDDRTVNADVLKVAAEDQFETVGYGPRIPVPHDLGD